MFSLSKRDVRMILSHLETYGSNIKSYITCDSSDIICISNVVQNT